jgi:two-component sensor histidine kinase
VARNFESDVAPAATGLFLAELSHRINNEYATAISMLSVAAARAESEQARAALEDAGARLHEYARVHRALQMPAEGARVDAFDRIREVCWSISRSKLQGRGIALKLVEHPLEMEADRCWRLCLILSELVTNAVRHAFATTEGAIEVEVRPSHLFIACRVTDNGCAPQHVRPGRGLAIVEALARTLDGSVEFSFGARGSAAVVTIPRHADDAGSGEPQADCHRCARNPTVESAEA